MIISALSQPEILDSIAGLDLKLIEANSPILIPEQTMSQRHSNNLIFYVLLTLANS